MKEVAVALMYTSLDFFFLGIISALIYSEYPQEERRKKKKKRAPPLYIGRYVLCCAALCCIHLAERFNSTDQWIDLSIHSPLFVVRGRSTGYVVYVPNVPI
ncbi:hypothetical protein F5X96DRAFT_171361 [Biscogniauxia mediterranea]|nr:hypothetical protein F5X96DRAFT_171361 [Biscogniauxia mediterranea]